MTTLSRISMAAVAALVVGVSSANAADLGGNCCADLEERIAELEATTARKGTRKVSLTISGQISQQLLFWDDGNRSDVYVNGPNASNSRWRFLGSAKISPEVTAGFLYELEAFASSSATDQTNGGDDKTGTGSSLREALAWIEHSRLGRITIGHGSTAANNAILVDLSGKGMAASNDVTLHNSGFFLHLGGGTYSVLTWANMFNVPGGTWLNPRLEHIQYRTPTIAGFSMGASFGEDNYWDVEGRYSGEFNGVRIAARLGYSVNSEFNTGGGFGCATQCSKKIEQLAGSLSVRHMPTGLFFTGAAGTRDVVDADIVGSYDANFYYLSGGVARNFTGLGDTVFYGEYSKWTGNTTEIVGLVDGPDAAVDHWGVGIVQHVDAAAMEFWLAYKNYSVSGVTNTVDDLQMITAGTRIRF